MSNDLQFGRGIAAIVLAVFIGRTIYSRFGGRKDNQK